MTRRAAPDTLSRRQLGPLALGLAGLASGLTRCAGKGGETDDGETGGGVDSSHDSAPDSGLTDADVPWASGGTASMAVDYPDPFGADAGTVCAMICEMTAGPCYATTAARIDISEGYGGLPMRLALRVVDESCQPVEGLIVDIWHAAPNGLYSGADADPMCTTGDSDMVAHSYFRGRLTTDKDGRVNFNSCFPGWYASRAVHIHFQLRTGLKLGSGEYVTSQLFFEQPLIDDIYTNQADYSPRGLPDTPNDADKILADNDPAPFTLATARQQDGSLLAYKTLVVRSSLDTELCKAKALGGPS